MNKARGHITNSTIAIFVVLVCALILRLHNLTKYDLWLDEQGTDVYSSQNLAKSAALSGISPFSLMIKNMKNDPHSSFYYLLVYAYSVLFGDGKSLRVLSVIFSMLSLWLLYRISRVFFDRKTSIYALVIMAINPFHLWYAQEARAYAAACFFTLLLVYVYMKALETNKTGYWVSFPVASTLAVFSSYFSGLLLIVMGVGLLLKNKRDYLENWIQSLLVTAIFLLLFRYIMVDQLDFVKNNFWLPVPSATILLFTWKIFTLGFSATGIQYHSGLVLFFVLFGYGAYSYYRSNKANAIILLLFLFFPILATYLFSRFVMPIYIHRQLLIFSPFYYLFVAKGIGSIKNNWVKILAVLSVLGLTTNALVNYYNGFLFPHGNRSTFFLGVLVKRNYSDLMAYLEEHFEEGDLIATTDVESHRMAVADIIKHYENHNYDPSEMFCFLSYPIDLQPFDVQYLQIEDLCENLSSQEMNALHTFSFFQDGSPEMDKIRLDQKDFKRIWLISSSWMEGSTLSKNALSVKNYISKNFERILFKERDGINVELYTKRIN